MEVITYGGGELLRDIFNAVAALVGGNAYLSALRLAFTLGLLLAIFITAFSFDFMKTVQWFVFSLIVYLVLMVPKTNVQIIDRFDDALPDASIANVPIGLAFIANMTSTVGDQFTHLTETTFGVPTDLEYHENGFIFGSRIFKDAMGFQITDATFSSNLSGFVSTCVFYDLLENRYSVSQLRETDDLWNFITITNAPNPARHFEWINQNNTTQVRSCSQAVTDLNPQWAAEVNRIATIYGKQISPNLTEAAAQALVIDSLAESHDFFLGTSQTAAESIRQVTLGNLINKTVRDHGAELGAEAMLDAYGQAMLDTEMGHAIKKGARLAEWFVPLFRTVAEALFYGLFPILFPLFLLPETGLRMLKGYAIGMVTLMAWGPLYVILHRIMLGAAELRSLGASYTPASDEAITLVTQRSIEAVHADISMIAGYLTLMIPFMAAKLGQGATAFASLSQSFLHPAQSAAQSTAREMATGNISLGNTGFNTHRFSSLEGNRQVTSGFLDVGEGSWNTMEGGRTKSTTAGQRVYDGTGAVSRGAMHIDYQSGLSASLQSEASRSLEEREAAANRSSMAYSAISQNVADLTWEVSQGRGVQELTGIHSSTEASESVNRIVTSANRFAERFTDSHDRKLAVEAYAGLTARKELGLPLAGVGRAEIGIRGSAGNETRESEIIEAARDAVISDSSNEGNSNFIGTLVRNSKTNSAGSETEWKESFMANYSEAQNASEDIEKYHARANAARDISSRVEHSGSQFVANWDNAFLDYMSNQENDQGGAIGYTEASRRWTSGDKADRLWVEHQAQNFIYEQANQLLEQPTLDNWQKPSNIPTTIVKSQEDIEQIASFNTSKISDLNNRKDQYLNDPIRDNGSSFGDITKNHRKTVQQNTDPIEQRQKALQTSSNEVIGDKTNRFASVTNAKNDSDLKIYRSKTHYLTGKSRLEDN